MKIELQVLFGLNCNFSCRHCLNSSKPGYSEEDISQSELEYLAGEVLSNKEVKWVSLSGGEPTLYLKKIEYLIKRIRDVRPEVKFHITTNGSLIEKNCDYLKDLKIDSCLISTDVFHSEFISVDMLLKNIEVARSIFNSVEIAHTISRVVDNRLTNKLEEYCIANNLKINFSQIVNSGRNNDQLGGEKQDVGLKCPNISEEQIKLTYYRNKGFSICSGPLVFNKSIEDSLYYFKNIVDFKDSLLFSMFQNASKLHFSFSQRNDCNNCKEIFENLKITSFMKSFSEDPWKNVVLDFSEESFEKYNLFFKPRLIKLLKKKDIVTHFVKPTAEDEKYFAVSGRNLVGPTVDEFTNFTIKTFYNKFFDHYSLQDVEEFKKSQKIFFGLENRYFLNYYNNVLVGCVVVCMIEKHKFFNEPIWHVGYWGIDSEMAPSNIANRIKYEWQVFLTELNKENPITATIDFYNVAANKFSSKINFKTVAVRMDKR